MKFGVNKLLSEGKHWPEDYIKVGSNMIKNSDLGRQSWYSDNDIQKDLDTFADKFESLSHKNSNLGYFSPLVRWFIEYSTDKNKCTEFKNQKLDKIIKGLQLLVNDSSLESKYKEKIKKDLPFAEFEKIIDSETDKMNSQDATKRNVFYGTSEWKLIPINSYEELHGKFGGDRTGYYGKSEWCHSNGKSTYNSWTENGTKAFFVLAKDGWKKIKPSNPETTTAFDEYGISLIAILVDVKSNDLLRSTLRWNHVIDPSKSKPKASVDEAFLGWGDLNETVGMNVDKQVSEFLEKYRESLKHRTMEVNQKVAKILNGLTEITENTIPNEYRKIVTEINIPNSITDIGDGAFWEYNNLTSVTIPDSVTSIGSNAFFACINLTSVTIPSSVTSIKPYAFSDCINLTSVTIPDSVTDIEFYAFYNCRSLTSITIPNSVKEIGDSAFSGCTRITSITIPDSVTSIGRNAFIDCDGLKTVTIPNSVKSIGFNAFAYCVGLKSIIIPDSITSIESYAFYGCTSLTSVTIPSSVTNIGSYAFQYCFGLTSITIPDSVTKIEEYAFSNCTGITSVTIPDSVTDIEYYAFFDCSELTSIIIPDSVTFIGNSAFENCIHLTSVTIPSSVTTIGSYAFNNINSNAIITIPKDFDKEMLRQANFPETVKFKLI